MLYHFFKPMVIEKILKGNKKAIADALNLVESSGPEHINQAKSLIEVLSRKARTERHIIGITGPPGVGKSTLVSCMIEKYRSQDKTVGVIFVDPSSMRSGGALLGDRARIAYDPGDSGIFIRSMAARDHLGGLAWYTRHLMTVFEAAFDRVIIETVGVGQSETEIEQVVDTVIFVIQPGSGDSLQFMKAGIMEIPHILVINKSDQQKLAMKASNDIKSVFPLETPDNKVWQPELLMTSCTENTGLDELLSILKKHLSYLKKNDLAKKRRMNRIRWIYMIFKERFGSFGLEVLGGKEKVLKRIAETDV